MKVDPRNLLLNYYHFTREFRFQLWDNNPILYAPGPTPPMDDKIVNMLEDMGNFFESEENLEWFDSDGVRFSGLSPELKFAGERNRFLFGDCSNLTGVISPGLYGDISTLSGELSPDLEGFIPLSVEKLSSLGDTKITKRLTGDITGLRGNMGWSVFPSEMLFGSLHRDLVGNITGLRGEINERLKGDITGLVGKVDPELFGDCSGIKGTITGLSGDCTGLIGRCSGLVGDCTGIAGDCTGLVIDLGEIPYNLRPNRVENFSKKVEHNLEAST